MRATSWKERRKVSSSNTSTSSASLKKGSKQPFKIVERQGKDFNIEERLAKVYELFELLSNYLTTRVSTREVAVFLEALSFSFSQGIPIISSIRGIAASSSPKMARALENIATYLINGSSLYKALAKFPWIFEPVIIKLVQIGEFTGELSSQLKMAARYLEEKEKLRTKLISAIQYPFILFIMMVVIFGIFVKFVFPMLEHLGVPKGWSAYFFAFAKFLGSLLTPSFLITLSLIFVIIYILTLLIFKLEPEWIVGFKYKIPFLGRILLRYDLIVLFYSLDNLYASGVSLETGIRILRDKFKGPLGNLLEDIHGALVRGESISSVVEEHEKILPKYVIALVKVGEESGHLGGSFRYAVKLLEEDVDLKIKVLSSLLEPIIMIGMGFLVLLIFLAILPIFMRFYKGDAVGSWF